MERYILHSAKGTGWANHKYISKYFKNGQWQYVYPKVKNAVNNFSSGFKTKTTLKPVTTTKPLQYKKTKEYYTLPSKGTTGASSMKKTTEYTANGNKWLSSSYTITDSSGNKKVYKTKGKISQAVEQSAKKGADFISNIGKKKKKVNKTSKPAQQTSKKTKQNIGNKVKNAAKNAKNKVNNAITDYNDKHTYINGKSMYDIKREKANKKK